MEGDQQGPQRTLASREFEAKREKTWAECGIEEKVERIREELQQQRRIGRAALNQANVAHELAHYHQHAADGEVLQRARQRGLMAGEEVGQRHDPLR